MKKILVCLSLLLLLIPGFSKKVYAEEEYDYDLTYYVVFTADQQLIYKDSAGNVLTEYNFELPGMLPGDTMRLTFKLQNEYSKAVDYYMYNNSAAFETLSVKAENAAYDYNLTYSGKEAPIYSSDLVGGDEMQGFEEATDALKEYFLLQNGFSKGREESVSLVVTLDGETQVNAYQDTFGDVKFKFAVEVPPEPTERHEERIIYIPNTGDSNNMNIYIIAEVLSLILLGAALYSYYRYLKNKREA